jgi:ribosomal protein L31E
VRDGGKKKGRLASADFLSGKSTLKLPEIPNPQGNPVVLYFLERDVREMERITKGKQHFFRKRVRLALADADQVKPVTIHFEGRDIKADEVRVHPYLNDPVMKARAEKYEKKVYIFTLSNQVPGGVYQIRTTVASTDEKVDAPLVDETMTFVKLRK